MQKAKIKLFVKGRMAPLFKCDIADDVEATLKSLEDKLNDKASEIVSFGQICFKRSDFRYYEVRYK